MNMYLNDFLIQEHTTSLPLWIYSTVLLCQVQEEPREDTWSILVCLVEFHLSLSVDQKIVILIIRANSEENWLALT